MAQSAKRTDRRTLLWLLGLLGLACLLIFQSYLLGNETLVFSDIGSDTQEQYIMHYNSIVNHLRAGDLSFWDFTNGFGVDMFIMNLMEPFLMAVYLLGVLFGPEHLTYYMVYVMIAEILLAGVVCYFYLSEFSLEGKYKLPVCLMYGFNSYLTIWGQHYQLGSVTVLLPLLLLFIERSFRKKRSLLGVALASAMLLLNGFYQGYMCMLGGGIYVAFRALLIQDGSWRERFKQFGRLAVSMVFGVALGAVNLLPAAAAQVMETSRLDSSQSLWQRILGGLRPWPWDYYKTLIYRLFGSNLQRKGSDFIGYGNYYEAANVFFSTLFVILLVQYVLNIRRQKKSALQKAAQYLAVLAAVFLVAVPLGSLAFNGFAYRFSRHTFLLMPLFALMSALTLQQILRDRQYSIPGFALAAAAILVVYAQAYRNTDMASGKGNILMLCLTGLGMIFVLLWMLKKKNADRKLAYLALVSLLFVNVTTDTAYSFADRATLKKNDIYYYEATYESSVQEALAWIASQDDSFYRVEKTFQTASGALDSSAQDYMGASTYNGTISRGVKAFVQTLWEQLMTGSDNIHYYFRNTLREHVMASLTGVKYLLSHSEELKLPGYELYHQTGDVYIYRNTETDSIGKFYTKTISQDAYEEIKDETDTWSLLREVLIVDGASDYAVSSEDLKEYQKQEIDLLKQEEMDAESCRFTEDGIEMEGQTLILPVDTEMLAGYEDAALEITLELDAGSEVIFTVDGENPASRHQDAGRESYTLAVPAGTGEICIEIGSTVAHAVVKSIKFTGAAQKSEFLDQSGICIDTPETDGHLTGSITAAKDGMVMLAIPCDSGWSVYLNGEGQKITAGDYGFISFEVKAGEYEFEAVYHAPLLFEGAIISLVSLLAFMVLWFISGKRRRQGAADTTQKKLW